jgi:DNA-directed RNA polymerase subunit M/transcription elongation factor TFIIS
MSETTADGLSGWIREKHPPGKCPCPRCGPVAITYPIKQDRGGDRPRDWHGCLACKCFWWLAPAPAAGGLE